MYLSIEVIWIIHDLPLVIQQQLEKPYDWIFNYGPYTYLIGNCWVPAEQCMSWLTGPDLARKLCIYLVPMVLEMVKFEINFSQSI